MKRSTCKYSSMQFNVSSNIQIYFGRFNITINYYKKDIWKSRPPQGDCPFFTIGRVQIEKVWASGGVVSSGGRKTNRYIVSYHLSTSNKIHLLGFFSKPGTWMRAETRKGTKKTRIKNTQNAEVIPCDLKKFHSSHIKLGIMNFYHLPFLTPSISWIIFSFHIFQYEGGRMGIFFFNGMENVEKSGKMLSWWSKEWIKS